MPALVAACTDPWYNQTLCKVNDSVVRLGVLQGEYHWHKHDNEDEFFFVLEGRFSSTSRPRVVAAPGRVRRAEGHDASAAGPGAGGHPDGRDRRHGCNRWLITF